MRRWAILICVAMCAALCGPLCAALAEPAPPGDGFALMAQTETRALWLNEKTMEIRFADIATGRSFASKVMDGKQGNKTVKNLQKSDLFVTYIANEKIGTVGAIDNYALSVALGAYEVKPIDHGFSVRYTIGDTTLTIDSLPKMIPVEKYNEMLLPFWNSADEKLFRQHYRVVGNTMWVRQKDDGMGGMIVKQLYGLLFEAGKYTREDMEADNAAFGHVVEKMNPSFAVTLRYTLDGDDLVVTLPVAEIEQLSGHNAQMIELLPYLMTGGADDAGYLFVPDGSGSLISLNSGKTTALAYTNRIYGKDVLKNLTQFQFPTDQITMPVYGVKTGEAALLAIVEKGAEIAEIYADIAGKADEFNRVCTRFILRDIENISLIGSDTVTTPRYPDDVYQGDIVVRYKPLFGGEANYTGMAHAYRAYLIAQGDLTERPDEPEAPFFMDIIGAVMKQKFFLGIPYQSSVQATTIAEAGQIYAAARNMGIRNVKMLFSGLFWGGVRNAALTNLSVDGGMGGEAALRALQKTLAANGDTLFPSVYVGRVYHKRGYDWRAQSARKLDGDPSWIVMPYEAMMVGRGSIYMAGYISPHALPSYIEKTKQQFEKTVPGVGLSVLDLGNTLTPDYKRRAHLSRIHATPVYEQALASLRASFPLMLTAPNAYALASADYVTGLPMSDNAYQIADMPVPFQQLVLDGCVPYSGRSWNGQSHRGMRQLLLEAVETKSAPRFTFIHQPETIFQDIFDVELQSVFTAQDQRWVAEAAGAYAAYNEFYQKVRDARILSHEALGEQLKRVTYDNGVVVLVNYGQTDADAGGVTVPAESFLVSTAREEGS